MTLESLLDSPLWKEFEQQTRRQKKKPADVLAAIDFLKKDKRINGARSRSFAAWTPKRPSWPMS